MNARPTREIMTKYDFSEGLLHAVVPATGKSSVTIYLDDDFLEAFRVKAKVEGKVIKP